MGVYVSVRGWLECDAEQLDRIKEIVRSDLEETYSGGWAFPARQHNWTHYVFYGADMRESAIDWILSRLRAIAEIPATDDDNDRITGFFLASHEVSGMSEWQIRDGRVLVQPASPAYRYLDE